MVGKIIGYTLLSIVVLIVAVLFVKIRFRVEYSHENTNLALGWLFLKIQLYPQNKPKKPKSPKKEKAKEEKPKKPEKEKPKKPEEEKTEQPAKKSDTSLLKTFYEAEGIDGIVLLLKRICRYFGSFFGGLLHSVVVTEFYLDISCTKNDAAETALYYGEVCSTIFPMLGALVSKCRVKKYDIHIYPDFIARFSDASYVLNFYVRPAYIIGITAALVFKMIFRVVLQIIVKISSVNKSTKKPKDENKPKNTKEKSEVVHE